jgi:hypothetical protein
MRQSAVASGGFVTILRRNRVAAPQDCHLAILSLFQERISL